MKTLVTPLFSTLLLVCSGAVFLTACGEDEKQDDPTPTKTYETYSVRYSQTGIQDNADGTRAKPQFTIGVCKPDFGRPEHDATCQTAPFFDQQDLSRTLSNDSKTVTIPVKDVVPGQKIYFATHYYSYYHNRPTPGSSIKAELLGDNEVLSTMTFTAAEAADPQYFNPNCSDPNTCGGEAIKIIEYTIPKS